jgi:ParB/RepB/Spo0J family partition protein
MLRKTPFLQVNHGMMGTGGNLIAQETISIPIIKIGERFASLRIADPPAELAVLHSLQKYGQLTPVVICRITPGEYELLDGFKRLRAARQLGYSELTVRTLEISLRACKAAMLQLNRVGSAISGIEEALVVHSLCHEDGLSQVEIAVLLGRHKSWVCRRLALIERLSDEAQESIRLGLLPASFGAELARLQRCNQDRLLASIRKHHLSWRETRKVVTALLSRPTWEHENILRDPWTVLQAEEDILISPLEEKGLGLQARQMQQKLITLEKICLDVALLFSCTELGQFETDEEKRLRAGCARALVSLGHTQKALREAADGIEP